MLNKLPQKYKNIVYISHVVVVHLIIGLLFGAKYREQLDMFLDGELFKLINVIHYLRNFI